MAKKIKKEKIDCNNCKLSFNNSNKLYCTIRQKDRHTINSSAEVTEVDSCSWYKSR